ncbi:MAG: 3-hydroxyacyl-CoA dehydrogenase [Yoonia sp.]
MSIVNHVVNENICIISMANRPVNALSKAIRVGVIEAMTAALSNDDVDAIIITSELALFSAGADITEFSGGDLAPMLPDVLTVIENSHKPVVAAINGGAFGGGLEVALACHYRVTTTHNRVGLPEVHLGILPGAGGTQRLPRLITAEKALHMIVSGAPTPVKVISELFVSIVEPADLLSEALAIAKNAIGKPIPATSLIELAHSNEVDELCEQTRAQLSIKGRGFFAPSKCIDAVKAAFQLPFEAGLKREGELFTDCMRTPQARAQQHFFFAERAASALPQIAKDTPVRDIKKVAIIGAGTMGGGIAMNFANAGIPVVLLELEQSALDKGLALIRRNYESSAKKGKLTQDQVEQCMSLLSGTTAYEDLSDVDLVIEAVFEKMSVKKQVFEALDRVCKPGAILASNTSTLDLDEIAACVSRPQDVIGLHFFSPANVMKLLEIVQGSKTADDVIKTSMKLAKTIKKVGVLVGVCFGFVGNRMIEVYGREAGRLMLEGATPEQIDKVIFDFGLPMGPFTMGDMAGLDIGYFVRQSRQEFIRHDPSYCTVADELVEAGRVGLKAGKGVYLYEQGSRKPVPDPSVLDIAKRRAKELGIEQRSISDQEILERCIYPLINEGANILVEGIAQRSSDIDVIYVYGYGFPVYRGGPMQYADEVGVDQILARMKHYESALGEYGKHWFTPSPLLIELAQTKQKFATFKA